MMATDISVSEQAGELRQLRLLVDDLPYLLRFACREVPVSASNKYRMPRLLVELPGKHVFQITAWHSQRSRRSAT